MLIFPLCIWSIYWSLSAIAFAAEHRTFNTLLTLNDSHHEAIAFYVGDVTRSKNINKMLRSDPQITGMNCEYPTYLETIRDLDEALNLIYKEQSSNGVMPQSLEFYRGVGYPPEIVKRIKQLKKGCIIPSDIIGDGFSSTSLDQSNAIEFMNHKPNEDETIPVLIKIINGRFAVDIERYKKDFPQKSRIFQINEYEFIFLHQTQFRLVEYKYIPWCSVLCNCCCNCRRDYPVMIIEPVSNAKYRPKTQFF